MGRYVLLVSVPPPPLSTYVCVVCAVVAVRSPTIIVVRAGRWDVCVVKYACLFHFSNFGPGIGVGDPATVHREFWKFYTYTSTQAGLAGLCRPCSDLVLRVACCVLRVYVLRG